MIEYYQIELKNDILELTKWRTNDTCIMDKVLSKGLWSNPELICINKVRQYMQVTTLSDICTYRGDKILKHTISGTKHPSCSSSKHNWPQVPKTPQAYIKLWCQAIRKFTSTRSKVKDQFILQRWTSSSRLMHKWWYNETDNQLYRKTTDDKWEIWTITILHGQRTRG